MSRSLVALALVLTAVTVSGTGCTMCASPYDYCGPVYSGGCEPCIVNARVGSNLCDPGVGPMPMVSPNPMKRTKPGAGGADVNLEDRNLPDLDEDSPESGNRQPENEPLPPPALDDDQPPSAKRGPAIRR